MSDHHFSRREALKNMGAMAMGAAFGPQTNVAGQEPSQERPGMLNVRDFGAKGDGTTDDTAAFQAALQAASEEGGNLVFVPRGRYRIEGTLNVPQHVVLEGVFRAPTARTQHHGSTLLAFAGAGEAEGEPLITLHQNATLRGLTIFYPEQKQQNPPVPYPWTIRGIGDNCSLVDVLLVNPYQAVDFGTHPAGRHFIKGLYAQPLYRGLFIDQCYDVGRVEDVHFWPFWGWGGGLKEFMLEEGIAFIIGRTDWEYLFNCFCINYRIGFHFIGTKAGAPNCVLTQCGSDVGPTAVRVSQCQPHAGLSFVNGQFMAGIEIEATNEGPVKFTACGFWPIGTTDQQAILEGRGHTTFNGCHFAGWANRTPDAPAIDARRGGLTVMACDFMAEGKTPIRIGPDVEVAIIVGNRFRGGGRIFNAIGERAQIGVNAHV